MSKEHGQATISISLSQPVERKIRKKPRFDESDDDKQRWLEMAVEARRSARWRCPKCGVDFSEHKDRLAIRYKNGLSYDKRKENLDIICKRCLANERLRERALHSDFLKDDDEF